MSDKEAPLLENEGGAPGTIGGSSSKPKKKKSFLPFSTRVLWLILGPVVGAAIMFVPVEPGRPRVGRMAGIVIWMGMWWITEPVPIATTALLPLVLFPMTDIMKAKAISLAYIDDKIFLLIGAFFISQAVEKTNLHRRIALTILLKIGVRPRALIAGFMLATALLSMWISNTATTAMMIPIALSILSQLEKRKDDDHHSEDGLPPAPLIDTEGAGPAHRHIEQMEEEKGSDDEGAARLDKIESMDPGALKYARGVTLAIAYAASLGGTATLVGTGPNLVLSGQMSAIYGLSISFTTWFLFAFPLALVFLVIVWFYICCRHYPWDWKTKPFSWIGGKPPDIELDISVFEKEMKEMGSMDFKQRVTLLILCMLALSWFLREPPFPGMPSWAQIFENPKAISDGTTVMLYSMLLFIIPARTPPNLGNPILDKNAFKDIPWGIVILIGGGFAVAQGFTESGLTETLGEALGFTSGLNRFVLLVFLTTFVCFLTEFTSNVATSSFLMPILALLANTLGINPLYLMVPSTIACSYAFMFPVATPPNALAFATGYFTIKDMVKAGIWMNFMGIIVLDLMTISLGQLVFKLGTNPNWCMKSEPLCDWKQNSW